MVTSDLIKLVGDVLLGAVKEMQVELGGLGSGVAQSSSNLGERDACRSQQSNVGVAKAVDGDGLNTEFLATAFHLVRQLVLSEIKDAPVGRSLEGFDMFGDGCCQKAGHRYVADTVGGLGSGEHVLSLDALIGAPHHDQATLVIDVHGAKREQLATPQAAPVQNQEGQIDVGFVHHGLEKGLHLFLVPEGALAFRLFRAKRANLSYGIAVQTVVIHRMIYQGTELVANCS